LLFVLGTKVHKGRIGHSPVEQKQLVTWDVM
jgi:hypothetical protein